jgi:phosphoglucosamine mutase
MKQYFGTDGIRGVAGDFPLDARTVYAIGLALGDDMRAHGRASVVIGQDTRESSPWIAETLAGGLSQRGIRVASAGVITTPGIAYLTRVKDFAAGVMISASHNPYRDNGIKVFDHSGYKLPDSDEAEVERGIEQYRMQSLQAMPLSLPPDSELRERYLSFLADLVSHTDFSRLSIVVDCANGAASPLAGELFQSLGFRLQLLEANPDGRNINQNCGALHPEAMAQAVVEAGADAGVAFDGDADRAIFANRRGEIVNGDLVLLAAARALKCAGRLSPPIVIGTVMSNLGLELALAADGVGLERTPVGDKYVLERMLQTGAQLGGEQSGHVIFKADATTGDGLLTALRIFEIMANRRQTLDQLVQGFKAFPQLIVNVRVREKVPFNELPPVQRAIADAQSHFGDRGRVIVRYSGTEKLARVMVEAESETDVSAHCDAIAAALRSSIGTDDQ